MGKKKTKKKQVSSSSSSSKTKKTKQKGGFPFGFSPIMTYNDDNRMIDFVIQDGVDKTAYAQRNNVYPTLPSMDSFGFDFKNVYDKTYNFFNETPRENRVKSIKIGINTDDDIRKINVLNKIIQVYNNQNNIFERQQRRQLGDKAQQFGGDPAQQWGGVVRNPILSSVMKTFAKNPEEMKIAENLIKQGVVERALKQKSPQVLVGALNRKQKVLKTQNEILRKELAELIKNGSKNQTNMQASSSAISNDEIEDELQDYIKKNPFAWEDLKKRLKASMQTEDVDKLKQELEETENKLQSELSAKAQIESQLRQKQAELKALNARGTGPIGTGSTAASSTGSTPVASSSSLTAASSTNGQSATVPAAIQSGQQGNLGTGSTSLTPTSSQ